MPLPRRVASFAASPLAPPVPGPDNQHTTVLEPSSSRHKCIGRELWIYKMSKRGIEGISLLLCGNSCSVPLPALHNIWHKACCFSFLLPRSEFEEDRLQIVRMHTKCVVQPTLMPRNIDRGTQFRVVALSTLRIEREKSSVNLASSGKMC
jgi:hypothetical protein